MLRRSWLSGNDWSNFWLVPRRSLAFVAALAVLVVGGAIAGAGVLAAGKYSASTTTSGAEIRDPDLAAQFAPVMVPMEGEAFLPIDRPTYVAHTDLIEVIERRHGHRDFRLIDPAPSMQTLGSRKPCLTNCHWALKVAGLDMHYGVRGYAALEQRLMRGRKPTVYWHIVAGSTGKVVQYWFFYLFDDWTNWHESDLEQISIRLDASGKKPCEVGYSQHDSGERWDWRDVEKLAGSHPVVYVALGSHANYFKPTRRAVKVNVFGTRVFTGFDDANHSDRARQLGPHQYQLVRLGFPVFRDGDYGSGNFGANGREHPRLLGNRITVGDPRMRGPAWDDPGVWLRRLRPGPQQRPPQPGC